MFNLLEIETGDKVDFWMLTESAFDQSRFARRYLANFLGQPLYASRPEDTILKKLEWSELSEGSEKQLSDVRGVVDVNRDSLDIAYLRRWAELLNVDTQLDLILNWPT